jgi:hypothetical protein
MYIVAQHTIEDIPTAFARGQKLLDGEGTPPGVRLCQFLPSRDRSAVMCLWEGNALDDVRHYVDATMGDSSETAYFEVDAVPARGLPHAATVSA